MTADPKSPDELPRLLSALEDGTLDAADEALLVERLRTDPAARSKYYEFAMLSALLRREGRRAAIPSRDQRSGSSDAPRPVAAALTRSKRSWMLVAAASALLALALSVGEATGVTQLVPTIVRVVTGEGALVIEVDDPAVSVTLDGEDVTISGAGLHELRLRPGTHKFVATKDGQPLREEVVTIERGGRQIVKVSRQPLPAASEAAGQPQVSTALASSSAPRLLRGHIGRVWNVAFAGDRLLTAGEDHWVRVWDVVTGEEVQRFDGHAHTVYALAVSPDGRLALSGSGCHLLRKVENVDWSVCLWEIASGKELHRLEGNGPGITSVAFSADGTRALLAGYEGTVRLWDVAGWDQIRQFQVPRGLWSVCFSPDGARALTAGGELNEAVVALWDLETGERLQRYVGHKFGAWHAIFLPDGSVLSAGQDETVRHWQTAEGKQIGMLTHQDQVARLAATADGQFLLAGTFGGQQQQNLRLWQLRQSAQRYVFPGFDEAISAVALSPDGKHAAAAGPSGRIGVWTIPPHVLADTQSAANDQPDK